MTDSFLFHLHGLCPSSHSQFGLVMESNMVKEQSESRMEVYLLQDEKGEG
jgi:hypothetical protein